MDNVSNTSNGVNAFLSWHPEPQDFVHADRFAYGWQTSQIDSVEELIAIATRCAWSPIIFVGGQRNADHFSFADFGALDIDGTYDLSAACKEWCDTIGGIVTTKRDSPSSRRFRIIFQFETRITNADQYVYNMDQLSSRYDTDPQATLASQWFWSGKEIIHTCNEGYKQPVLPLPGRYQSIAYRSIKAFDRYRNLGRNKIFPQNIANWLRGINVENERNNHCYGAAKYLTYWGMPPDKIFNLILNSELPLKNHQSLKEAGSAVERGIRKAKKVEEITGRQRAIASGDIQRTLEHH